MSHDTHSSGRSGVARLVLGVVVVGVAIGAHAFGLVREVVRRGEERAQTPSPAEDVSPVVTVYYFHGDTRCETCLAIEAQTADVVAREYAEEIASGVLRFEVVNFDEPVHRHFRDEYELAFGSVVVQGAGPARRWENLTDVWTYIHNDAPVFEQYLVEHITPMLDAAG